MAEFKVGDIIEYKVGRDRKKIRHVVLDVNAERIDQGHVTANLRNLETGDVVIWSGMNWETMKPHMSLTSAGGFYDEKKVFPDMHRPRVPKAGR